MNLMSSTGRLGTADSERVRGRSACVCYLRQQHAHYRAHRQRRCGRTIPQDIEIGRLANPEVLGPKQ
jgi:hypothetical protein